MSTDLRWLRSFVVAAQELNFSRAARRLHLAQPALTMHIQHLEEAVGASLFHRTNRIAGLTPSGAALLPEARAILARADVLRQTALRARDGTTGALRVGIIPPAALRTVADCLRRFARETPLVSLSIRQDNQDRLIQLLMEGDLDFVLGRPYVERTRKRALIEQRQLFVEQQGIILREDDPLAALERIPIVRLRGMPLLLLRGNPYFGQNVLQLAVRHRVSLQPSHVADDFPSLHWTVRAGLGVAPCSLLLADSLARGLVARPLRPAPPRLAVQALWRAPQAIPAAARLLELLCASIGES